MYSQSGLKGFSGLKFYNFRPEALLRVSVLTLFKVLFISLSEDLSKNFYIIRNFIENF